MSASEPTHSRAYGLRVTSPTGEVGFRFNSLRLLAKGLALRLHKAPHRIDHHIKIGPRTPYALLDAGGKCLTLIQETPYQAEHSRFGATWRIRVEWKAFEAFGEKGQCLAITTLLREFDLSGFLNGNRIRRVGHGERGHGPVRGTRKRRGGFGLFRRVKTAHERCLNSLVVFDEGEVRSRAARNTSNLPTSWSDLIRETQRNWKKQSKAGKQWGVRKRKQVL